MIMKTIIIGYAPSYKIWVKINKDLLNKVCRMFDIRSKKDKIEATKDLYQEALDTLISRGLEGEAHEEYLAKYN